MWIPDPEDVRTANRFVQPAETQSALRSRKRSVIMRSVFRHVFSVLAAVLLAVTAAAGEAGGDTWEERLAEARLRYNADTVNIYTGWRSSRSGKINVSFYRSQGRPQKYIVIYESLQVTDEAEMEAILEVVAANENYSEEIYGTMPFMKAEWIAHNIAYNMATGSDGEKKFAEFLAGENILSVVKRSKELDLSPLDYIPENEKLLYEMIELLYGLNKD